MTQLKFSRKLLISESMCHDSQQLAYKCRQLKNYKKVHSTWFWNNAVNIKVTPTGEIHQMFHTNDIKNILGIENLEVFINNKSFSSKFNMIFLIEFIVCLFVFLSMLVFNI